ncbi:MAG: hypothetical protein EB059_01060 [Alphaproteobacteria bacterium]|nr:hypothetical protein [Alphaproteobacteria bacterium]
MEFVQLKFKVLRLVFSLITSALLAWIITKTTEVNFITVFFLLVIGLPLAIWLERLKNTPAHLLSACLMNKDLVNETKNKLRRLPLKTAEEWNDFQSFYDSDQAIAEHTASDSKAFAVSTRYSIQTLRDTGNFLDFMNCGLISSRAIDQIYWEIANKEEGEFVRSKGYESWAEYMVDHGIGEDVRESYKEAALKEKQKREGKK